MGATPKCTDTRLKHRGSTRVMIPLAWISVPQAPLEPLTLRALTHGATYLPLELSRHIDFRGKMFVQPFVFCANRLPAENGPASELA